MPPANWSGGCSISTIPAAPASPRARCSAASRAARPRAWARIERSMEFDNSFEVPLPPAEAWKVLLDIERIAPCMPGAELTEVVDQNTYKGKIGVRLGPVALTFAGIVKFEQIDDAARTARVAAQGTDAKGRGGANAASVFRLEPAGSGSKVLVHTNLTLSGAVAQYGRGVGIIQATAAQLMNQFAAKLKQQLAQPGAAPAPAAAPPPTAPSPSIVPAASTPAATPISGFALMARVIWSWLTGLVKKEGAGPLSAALTPLTVLFLQRFLALFPDAGGGEHDQQADRCQQERQADRLLQEDERIAARDQERAPQVLLHHRSQHEAENERRRLAVELERDV